MLFIPILIIFGLTVLFTVHGQVSKLATENILDKLESVSKLGYSLLEKSYPGDWSVKDGQLYKGDKVINNDFTVVDEVKELTGSIATIAAGDTRVSTNLLNADGNRAVGTKITESISKIVLNEGKEYIGESDLLGKKFKVQYSPIKDGQGKVIGIWFVGVEKGTVDQKVTTISNTVYIVTIIAIILAILFLVLFTRQLVRNVSKILSALKIISSGDLRERIEVNSHDEIQDIGNNINTTIDNIRDLMNQIDHLGISVVESSTEMVASSEEISNVSEQIANAVDEIAKGATEQAVSTEQGNHKIKELVTGLKRIAQDMEKSYSLVEKAMQVVGDGEKSVNYQDEKVKENNQVSRTVSEAISDLSVKSNEIGQILEVIKSIADQTNLLALNAAIEAARAGEAGRGFAVVAEEIRKLAEQSALSTKKIGEIITEVQFGVSRAVNEINRAEVVVVEQTNALNETVEAFSRISSVVKDISQNIEQVSEAAGILCENAVEAGETIDNIASITQESAATTEEVAASTEEQASNAHQIANTASSLSEIANNLKVSIEKFKI
jgi:methyl-accepting chemotaxis protein